jgi:hypothetical protein
MPPTFGNGKICYVQIPAIDIARSAEFYECVFGWKVRTNREGRTSFDDGVGEVSGTWVLGWPPATRPGLMMHVMVDNAAARLKLIVANGGEIVQPIGADAPEITAQFRDPAGNIFGIYQHGGSR